MGKGYYIGSCFQGNICRIRVKTIQARLLGIEEADDISNSKAH